MILGEYYKRHEKEPLEDLSLDGVGITEVGAKLLEELFSMPAGLSRSSRKLWRRSRPKKGKRRRRSTNSRRRRKREASRAWPRGKNSES